VVGCGMPSGILYLRMLRRRYRSQLLHHVQGVRDAPVLPDPAVRYPLEQYLRERQLLLLLDNFERLPEAGPPLARLLSDCPRLKVLLTGRGAPSPRRTQIRDADADSTPGRISTVPGGGPLRGNTPARGF
jgi:hypothetical protein